ncbi:Hypothetical protein, putative [Bodo saltans]|uniref:Uncharacterized protein n=1 Tax=Bodo saltans TaxID=75058 RepID=A0A0S4ITL4_BODSA|nr:Hypothetical protein, putative [Bodo saltans]|eukprot:CUF77339.1 Hypothetical protein, putative [Bodo saltans]
MKMRGVREYRRVAIVGGARQCEAEKVGQNVGNEGPDPIYRYRDTYLYFHVKYLKDYLTRQAAASGVRVGDELSASILARGGPDDGKCLETQPNTCVVRPDKKEVSALKTYLRDSATGYAKKFSDDDLACADDLFLKYSTTSRGVAPPADAVETCAGDSDGEVTEAWNATCPRPWEALKGTPQEFVGFWLKHQYSFRDGRIEISKLNGHDADLAAAIAREFGVPRGHIECRVMFRDELNGHTATDETARYGDEVTTPDGVGPETYPRADDLNTLDDGAIELEKRKIESVVPFSEEQEREEEEEKERKDEEAQEREEEGDQERKEKAWKKREEEEVRNKEGRYGLVIGRNYRRVVVVGGAQHMADTGFGDLGSHTYLFFHVKYLKEYLLRQRKSRI